MTLKINNEEQKLYVISDLSVFKNKKLFIPIEIKKFNIESMVKEFIETHTRKVHSAIKFLKYDKVATNNKFGVFLIKFYLP
ncbi:uncharacterized protein ASCRUDRAFT_81771 [Ascoidea rubescens DSM 1968]|uniref:Uncharacterized protein n=1 Tax=Ascoidea rubescens DSM 1968 TaxID=1344418 RepID=A0A1D2VDX6_9ASCO|nr:hypothetical protein ASCRUDRAFT_81771 [Ascoidea rubescens DSM 1968]ODV59894.1 hypothetical protein ASCRUDRAFT_81771 [Ascoidea rubescens DSM 1968]